MREGRLQKKAQVDMINGSILDKLLLFALPLAASSILQQLFNAVDVAVVGRFASSEAQAAVGCNGSVINLFINLFVGISIGANVVIAQYIGQDRQEKIQAAVHTTIVIAAVSGIAVLILGMFAARPILTLMDTPEDVMEHAVLYLRIYLLGMPFIMVYNFGAAILRSIGDTKRPLICLVVSGVINAGLNLVLVIVFQLGVAGVAIATVVSNVISSGMVWHFLSHEEEPVKLSVRKLSIAKEEFFKILRIGIPAGVQGTVFSVSNVFIQTALNGYGSAAVAGSSISLNYEFISYFVISAFNQTTVTFTSQNFGAGKYDRCKKIFRLSMFLGVALTFLVSMTFVVGRSVFVGMFTTEPKVAEYAAMRMFIILSANFLCNTYEIGGAALRGIGYSMTPAILTVFGTCLLRLAWVWVVCPRVPGIEVLFAVYPITWIVTGMLVLASYFIIRRKVF